MARSSKVARCVSRAENRARTSPLQMDLLRYDPPFRPMLSHPSSLRQRRTILKQRQTKRTTSPLPTEPTDHRKQQWNTHRQRKEDAAWYNDNSKGRSQIRTEMKREEKKKREKRTKGREEEEEEGRQHERRTFKPVANPLYPPFSIFQLISFVSPQRRRKTHEATRSRLCHLHNPLANKGGDGHANQRKNNNNSSNNERVADEDRGTITFFTNTHIHTHVHT